jgi:hypothetical protein
MDFSQKYTIQSQNHDFILSAQNTTPRSPILLVPPHQNPTGLWYFRRGGNLVNAGSGLALDLRGGYDKDRVVQQFSPHIGQNQIVSFKNNLLMIGKYVLTAHTKSGQPEGGCELISRIFSSCPSPTLFDCIPFSPPTGPVIRKDNQYFIFSEESPNKVLSPKQRSLTLHTPIVVAPYDESDCQRWAIQESGVIVHVSSGFALDARGFGKGTSQIQLFTVHGKVNQLFRFADKMMFVGDHHLTISDKGDVIAVHTDKISPSSRRHRWLLAPAIEKRHGTAREDVGETERKEIRRERVKYVRSAVFVVLCLAFGSSLIFYILLVFGVMFVVNYFLKNKT